MGMKMKKLLVMATMMAAVLTASAQYAARHWRF